MIRDAESKPQAKEIDFGEVVQVTDPSATPTVLVVCEHASNRIPQGFNNLGLSTEAAQSHIAWDPGAQGVAQSLATALSACLVCGAVSRLVYDCNRPPDAASAIPERSEVFEIRGNTALTAADRAQRVAQVYTPFCDALETQLSKHRTTLRLMVTIHSFTPVYNGVSRMVELGILHGQDARFAHAMMQAIPTTQSGEPEYEIRLNEPYDAGDGVAHTLDRHGHKNDLLNVMIEVRNDLIATPTQQQSMAAYLAPWIVSTLDHLTSSEVTA